MDPHLLHPCRCGIDDSLDLKWRWCESDPGIGHVCRAKVRAQLSILVAGAVVEPRTRAQGNAGVSLF